MIMIVRINHDDDEDRKNDYRMPVIMITKMK